MFHVHKMTGFYLYHKICTAIFTILLFVVIENVCTIFINGLFN